MKSISKLQGLDSDFKLGYPDFDIFYTSVLYIVFR